MNSNNIVPGVAGGQHVVSEPLTTASAAAASGGLLTNEIDRRIVKIRPMSTPLDQISRYGGARHCGAMKVEYYSVDTTPVKLKLTAAVAATDEEHEGPVTAVLKVANPSILAKSTTVLVPAVKVTSTVNGKSISRPLMLYVTNSDANGVEVVPVNNFDGNGEPVMPAIPAGTEVIRMGRAAAELDVTTPQFSALPHKDFNLCQIFKAQVEESTFMKIANKEIGWSFSDQEEAAIIDMRMGMEKNFLMGERRRLQLPDGSGEILLTGGIWNQTYNDFKYSTLNEEKLVSLCKQAFSHNAGSSRKVLLAGSDLIEALHGINHTRVISEEKAVTKWGLDFTEIHSKFGTLYVLLSEVFDEVGMSGCGMIIDPEYITKYCHVPFRAEKLDLRSAGIRNTNAVVLTEVSCLVLRYPLSHVRIIKE
ncbi:MAG: hypothetical protein ACI30D_03385 [Muribaculaceae bacterium]|nr:DUF5309 family protein [Muribaculaceae bacterium]